MSNISDERLDQLRDGFSVWAISGRSAAPDLDRDTANALEELQSIRAENERLRKDRDEAIAEIERRDLSFDLRWKSDMRAIERWQKATGRTMTLPDHTDLSVWLFAQLEAAGAKLEEAAKVLERIGAIHYPPHQTLYALRATIDHARDQANAALANLKGAE